MSPIVKSCSTKRRYDSLAEAERYRRHGHTWCPGPGQVATVYRCFNCGGYHLSSGRKGGRRR
jgi:hypothetical protein